jgi:glycosyltransferase involved in cell wall biosynthesis
MIRPQESASDRTVEGHPKTKILQIGNYPPPVCGWAMQTKALVEEIRRRGNVCCVFNLNENRKKRSNEYIDVQNGFDYLAKLIRFAMSGYRFQVHVNGQSGPGYMLALIAAIVGKLAGRPVVLSWRGGLQQKYFPQRKGWSYWVFRLLFRLAGQISCNNEAVRQAIEQYGIARARIAVIPGFSKQNLAFQPLPFAREIEAFLESRHPVFFCYVSFRPEYRLPVLREAMLRFRQGHPEAGFIWLGFPSKELPAVNEFVAAWPAPERQSLLLLGNVTHDEFLTLLTRCFAYIRTPLCDGVAASVLESLALGIPVVASENGHRPANVTTYREGDAADLCAKLISLTESYDQFKKNARLQVEEDNIGRTVDWLLGTPLREEEGLRSDWVHVSY